MVPGREDMDHGLVGKGGVIKDGIHPRYILLSLQDCGHPGPTDNSDHYLVLGCIRSAPLREHTKYLGRRTRLPLQPPTIPTREYGLFAALRRATTKPKAREARKNVWILADMWRLVDKRVSTRWDPARDQAHI